MRLWSLDPSYLDAKGLVALWREGLLARAVLRGATKGYRHHPQLERFRAHRAPLSAINHYLSIVADDAKRRGYRFDRSKLGPIRDHSKILVTTGQIAFEARHLIGKLHHRSPDEVGRLATRPLRAHPIFTVTPGLIASWERGVDTRDQPTR